MFINTMNLNDNKLSVLVELNSSSNATSNYQNITIRSLNIQEQQQHLTSDSPRLSSSSNSSTTSHSNDSSLLMCGPNNHLTPNSSLAKTIIQPNHGPYPSTILPLYGSSPSSLSTVGAGKR